MTRAARRDAKNGAVSPAEQIASHFGVQRIQRQFAGVGASSLFARDFSYKLIKLGRNVMLDSDCHIRMADVSTLHEGDVLFALSYSGTIIETLGIAEQAKKWGAIVIAVTGLSENPLNRIAYILLYTSRLRRTRALIINNGTRCATVLTDLLFILLFQRQQDTIDYVHKSEAAVSLLKI